MPSIALHRLLKPLEKGESAATRVVACYDDRVVRYSDFLQQITILKAALDKRSEKRWLLFSDDSLNFMVTFFTLLASGKDVVIAPNKQVGTLSSLLENCHGALLSFSAESKVLEGIDLDTKPIFLIDELLKNKTASFIESNSVNPNSADLSDQILFDSNSLIIIATSGSTGQFSLIEKKLSCFIEEIDSLNILWEEKVNGCDFFSTVSHQHIYGLLFKLLWPLSLGCTVILKSYVYPEALFSDIAKNKGGSNKAVLITSPAHLKRMPEAIDGCTVKSQLQAVFSSGGPLSRKQSFAFSKRFVLSPIEVFGSTETGGVAYRQQHDNKKIDEDDIEETAWRVFPNTYIECDENQQLKVTSPMVFCDKPFVMGDKVHIINSQYFIHKGRADNIIKLEEKRLSLTAMEAQLKEHLWVEDARVILLPLTEDVRKTTVRQSLGAVIVLTQLGREQLDKEEKRNINDQLRKHLLSFFERVLLPRKWRYIEMMPCNNQSKTLFNDLVACFES